MQKIDFPKRECTYSTSLIILEVLPINWQFLSEGKQNSLAFLTAKSYNNTRMKMGLSFYNVWVIMSELLGVRNEITPTLVNTVANNILNWKLNSKSTFSSCWRFVHLLTLSNQYYELYKIRVKCSHICFIFPTSFLLFSKA